MIFIVYVYVYISYSKFQMENDMYYYILHIDLCLYIHIVAPKSARVPFHPLRATLPLFL